MRLWSLHPHHLDRQGLTACWREALLAQAVLAGRTKGYRHHPQLVRFRAGDEAPLTLIGAFLAGVVAEATARGYRFDATKIINSAEASTLALPSVEVTQGQVEVEWRHLLAKLDDRSPEVAARNRARPIELHPLFRIVPGPVADWESATGTR
ncbi:pyrimidine dimer DNA glycosylase/endonuclease V [Propionibacteriaceae bacterium Y1700]|uniref:pyrimidine dimer DNA glycosylase/endonuclease V n=1 Tax=Microlunatus sp. Y1700 TaxID=3418487 RepID=UPI003DA7536C